MTAQWLLLAYHNGIFPWYDEGLPILWHSPDPRTVLPADAVRVNRSLGKVLARQPYRLTLDQAFGDVMRACATAPRPEQEGTWITDKMVAAYCELHRLGYAHSVEAWLDQRLVGGLYGVSLGAAFFGESMFARCPDASKVAFVTLARQLARWGIGLIDCQVHTSHMERFGAQQWPRARFLAALNQALQRPTRRGRWSLDANLI